MLLQFYNYRCYKKHLIKWAHFRQFCQKLAELGNICRISQNEIVLVGWQLQFPENSFDLNAETFPCICPLDLLFSVDCVCVTHIVTSML